MLRSCCPPGNVWGSLCTRRRWVRGSGASSQPAESPKRQNPPGTWSQGHFAAPLQSPTSPSAPWGRTAQPRLLPLQPPKPRSCLHGSCPCKTRRGCHANAMQSWATHPAPPCSLPRSLDGSPGALGLKGCARAALGPAATEHLSPLPKCTWVLLAASTAPGP